MSRFERKGIEIFFYTKKSVIGYQGLGEWGSYTWKELLGGGVGIPMRFESLSWALTRVVVIGPGRDAFDDGR